MSVRVTLEIPEVLNERLRLRAKSTGATLRSLILQAIEDAYPQAAAVKKGERVTGPLIRTKGKLAPRFPADENPWDLIFP